MSHEDNVSIVLKMSFYVALFLGVYHQVMYFLKGIVNKKIHHIPVYEFKFIIKKRLFSLELEEKKKNV